MLSVVGGGGPAGLYVRDGEGLRYIECSFTLYIYMIQLSPMRSCSTVLLKVLLGRFLYPRLK